VGKPQENNNNNNMNPVKPGRFEMKPIRQTFTIQGLRATNCPTTKVDYR
jgi:hypothetical protein